MFTYSKTTGHARLTLTHDVQAHQLLQAEHSAVAALARATQQRLDSAQAVADSGAAGQLEAVFSAQQNQRALSVSGHSSLRNNRAPVYSDSPQLQASEACKLMQIQMTSSTQMCHVRCRRMAQQMRRHSLATRTESRCGKTLGRLTPATQLLIRKPKVKGYGLTVS